MTPAEKVAAAKKPRQYKSRSTRRNYPWKCGLRAERQKLRLALRDVAKGVGVSVAGLYEIERGSEPSLSTAMRLAAFFGRTVEQLWEMPKK